VRVIDSLAVYKDADGELEVEHLSNLSEDEAIDGTTTAGSRSACSPGPRGGDGEPNWPPTSAADPWFAILRMYRPHPEVIAASWKCPGITKAG
jgi:hypothetical protein